MKTIFHEIASDPHAYAAGWKKKTGGRVVGYFCSYAPEEIIHASGALPFRILGSAENISLANAHLQSYCCSLVRSGLEEALGGRLSFLDGTVFPHTCDSIQRLSDIWRLNAGFPFHLDVVLPAKLDTESAREYMVEVVEKFRRDLGEAMGKPITDEALKESVKLFNAVRAAILRLYLLRSQSPHAVSGTDLYAVMRAYMVMDRRECLTHLEEFLKQSGKKAEEPAPSGKKRVVLAGGICNHPDFYSIIEESGGSVVWDELCTGTRLIEGAIDPGKPLIPSIAQRYMDRVVCPAKHKDLTSRAQNLTDLVKRHRAKGVIFLYLKFCDPQSFDYPYMKAALEAAGIPHLLYEVDESPRSDGQIRTRFETFIEMI